MPRAYEVVTSAERLPHIAREMDAVPVVHADLETTALDPRLGKIRLCSVNTTKGVYLVDAFQTQTLGVVQEALGRKDLVVTGQNCLVGDTLVLLANGTTMRLDHMVRDRHPGPVVCIDESTGKLTTRGVTGWVKGSLRPWADWMRVRVRGKGSLGLTVDHEVLTTRGRVLARDLQLGDRILSRRAQFSEQQLAPPSLAGADEVVEVAPLLRAPGETRRHGGRSPFGKTHVRQFCLTVAEHGNFIANGLSVSNCKFDQKWLLHHGGTELARPFDTYRASSLIYNGKIPGFGGHNYYDICKRELGTEPTVQDLGGSDWSGPLSDAQLDYAADDVIQLPLLRDKLRATLVRDGLTKVAVIEFGAILPEAAMELNGFRLNQEKWTKLANANAALAEQLTAYLHANLHNPHQQQTFFGMTSEKKNLFNLDSPDQMLKSLREMGFKIEDTNEITLAQLNSPIITKLLEWRGVRQRVKSFGKEYLEYVHPLTGRIHTSYFPFTGAGRYASRSPNLQQLPREKAFRECFEAEDGWLLAIADYAAIELRIAAQLSLDPYMLRLFREGKDPHLAIAAKMLNLSYEEALKEKKLGTPRIKLARQAAKAVNFGFCVLEGQRVLTQFGLVPIEQVTRLHLVWDGVEWVQHEGLIDQGVREVITYQGLTATADHQVWVGPPETTDSVPLGEAMVKGKTLFRTAGTGGDLLPMTPVGRGKVYDLLNAGPRHRFTCEGVLVSNCYGMGWKKFGLYAKSNYGVTVTSREAQDFRKDYFETYPGIGRWHDKALRDFERNPSTRTILGRVRYLHEGAYSEVLNSPDQGCLRGAARVQTSQGYESVETLCQAPDLPSRRVWTGTTWASFTVVDKGMWQAAEIELSDGTVIPCDSRHKLLGVTDTGYDWVDFDQIVPEMKVATSLAQVQEFEKPPALPEVQRGPRSTLTIQKPIDLTAEEFWFWIGHYFGDGWKDSERGAFSASFGAKKKAVGLLDGCVGFWTRWGVRPRIVEATHTPDRKASTRWSCVWDSVDLTRWLTEIGIPDATSHTKRLPLRLFRESVNARLAFLQGFLATDGHRPDPKRGNPFLHLCQRPLLDDTRLLLRSLGVESVLGGPYQYEGHESWTLRVFHRMLQELETGKAGIWPKIAMPSPAFILDEVRERFGAVPHKAFPTASSYTLFRRIMTGGSVSVYTLRRLCEQMSWTLKQPLYGHRTVVSKRVLPEKASTYTLVVHDPLHRFDAEGVITKNSGADGLKKSLRIVYDRLKKFGGDAKMVHMVHDEIVVEHKDKDPEFADAVRKEVSDGMVEGMKDILTDLPCEAEPGGGKDWSQKG